MVAGPKSAAVVDEENDQCVVSAFGAGKVAAWLEQGMKPNRIDVKMAMEKEPIFMICIWLLDINAISIRIAPTNKG
jgi:hypothetical protein